MGKDAEKLWNKWAACHNLPGQSDRLLRGKSSKYSPVSIDKKNCSAKMQGRDGMYNVTLTKCDCMDFQKRQLPCKHMYRLAIELGLVNETASSYIHGGYSWKQAVEIVEQYPEDVQKAFYEVFMATNQDDEPIRKKKSNELSVLISDGLLVLSHETAQFYTVRPIEDFFKERKNIHYYFSRKFYPKTYYNGVQEVIEPFPDDEVTAFLVKRGFAPKCTSNASSRVSNSSVNKHTSILSLLFDVMLILIGIMLCNVSVIIGLIVIIYALYRMVKCLKLKKNV